MIRTNTSRFKARLGHYMRAVRSGKQVVVQDRDEPVARLVPFREVPTDADFVISQPREPTACALGDVAVRGIKYRGTDVVGDLRAERSRR